MEEFPAVCRPYADQLNTLLQNIASNLQDDISLSFAQQREANKVLLVIITSDKGLCGAFNANLIREAAHRILALEAEGYQVDLYCIGKKGAGFFKYGGHVLGFLVKRVAGGRCPSQFTDGSRWIRRRERPVGVLPRT